MPPHHSTPNARADAAFLSSRSLQSLPQELDAAVQRHWQSISGHAGVGEALCAVPEVVQTAARVWACSDFVARTCATKPTLLLDLLQSGDLQRPYLPGTLARRVADTMAGAESEDGFQRQLRELRVREAVRIAWRDLAGWADLAEVVATMSELADASLEAALDYLYPALCDQRGTPRDHTGAAVSLTILGLGKLGGRELNFSSDVDLIFAYAEDGQTDAARPISNHEFFTKLGRQVIQTLDQVTADGFVFRVDMRLRPNGNSGPLALSYDATEHYFQTHGRDWERYALIKARVVAGDREGGTLLLERLRPFVYRKYLDYGAFEAIRSMKDMIDRELRRKGMADNIKLGRGGIREVEFIAQSFQLIRGGRDHYLQTNRLQEALPRLAEREAISAETAQELLAGYGFLRSVEHRLQMFADQQTHVLPRDDTARARLALAAGYADWDSLNTALHEVMNRIDHHFNNVFVAREHSGDEDALTPLADLWRGGLSDSAARQLLSELGYTDAAEVWRQLRELRAGKRYHAHSKYGRERFDRLMPMLIHAAVHSAEPVATLTRLISFVDSVGRRSAYLMLLIENPLALDQLVKLCGASAWIGSWISRYPLLLDELLDPISAESGTARERIEQEFAQHRDQAGADDLEAQMEALREVHHAQVLKVAAADVSGLIDWTEVGRRLCIIAECSLEAAVAVCLADLRPRIGTPSEEEGLQPEFGIVAYGKLGSLELGYNSDLDIVFLHHGATERGVTSGGKRSVANPQYYGRLAQRLVHVITTHTPTGALYEIDMRLRPSGRAGPLVTSLSAFATYQRQQAWTWEHQALVRARVVTGQDSLRGRFEEVRRDLLTVRRDPEKLRTDVTEMREKMVSTNDQTTDQLFDLKQGRGGIIDIEFIVQYYVLLWAHEHPELTTPRNNIDLIAALRDSGLVDESVARQLGQAYHDYLGIEHRCKLAEQRPLVDAADLAPQREFVAGLWQQIFSG